MTALGPIAFAVTPEPAMLLATLTAALLRTPGFALSTFLL
jgi:hypothetical protein